MPSCMLCWIKTYKIQTPGNDKLKFSTGEGDTLTSSVQIKDTCMLSAWTKYLCDV